MQFAVNGAATGKGKAAEGPPCTCHAECPTGKSKGPPLPTFTRKPEVAKQQEPKAISAAQLIHWTFYATSNNHRFSIIIACIESLSRWTWHHPSSWNARQTRRRAGRHGRSDLEEPRKGCSGRRMQATGQRESGSPGGDRHDTKLGS